MSTLTQLKRLVAYYVRHHTEPQDLPDYGEAEFIDNVAAEILDRMPTADIEKIRPFLVDGNVNEWVVLGQIIEEALDLRNVPEDHRPSRIEEEWEYKFGDWRL